MKQQTETIRLAILSDLHAYVDEGGDNPPSHYCVPEDHKASPIRGLEALIRDEGLSADYVLCPGDLADRAHPVAIEHAWGAVHSIAKSLGNSELICTTGNHDIDSRYAYNNYDAKGSLQQLRPNYPFAEDDLCDRYWARHFVLLERDDIRFLVLNSSAFHGAGDYRKTESCEFGHGRISEYTLARIEEALGNSRPRTFNVLLCHHHPHPHSGHELGEDDLMKGGEALLNLAGSGRFGDWLVIHGHKHHARLESAKGGSNAPWVFAAGSLCANLFLQLQTAARNQFYICEFSPEDVAAHGFVGRFRSWDWFAGQGFVEARDGSGLPSKGGFGWRGQIQKLAIEVDQVIGDTMVTWEALQEKLPLLKYLAPTDLTALAETLKRNHSIGIHPAGSACPFQLGRAP